MMMMTNTIYIMKWFPIIALQLFSMLWLVEMVVCSRNGKFVMNIRQLAAFREVMLTGSMSEAARNLNRTQPAVSAQIAGLEDQVGLHGRAARRIDRHGHVVQVLSWAKRPESLHPGRIPGFAAAAV